MEIPGQTGKILEVSESGKYHAVIRYAGGCLSESVDIEVKVNRRFEDFNIICESAVYFFVFKNVKKPISSFL